MYKMEQRQHAEGAVGCPLGFWLNDSRCLWLDRNKIGVWSRDGRVADVTQSSVDGGDEKGTTRNRGGLSITIQRKGTGRNNRRLIDSGDKKREHQ
jgi:hypothetical protein